MDCKWILVIEDEKDIRETIQQVLELEGYQVLTAINGKEGLQILSENTKPCLILLDLMMPVMNGWEFLEAQKGEVVLATIPVVIVSAAGERAKSAGASAFIKKPVELESLLRIVEKYCRAA